MKSIFSIFFSFFFFLFYANTIFAYNYQKRTINFFLKKETISKNYNFLKKKLYKKNLGFQYIIKPISNPTTINLIFMLPLLINNEKKSKYQQKIEKNALSFYLGAKYASDLLSKKKK
ncbi:hypothetical protein [Blattabacterium cuenoti]|uniref:hypothetical protein n=1 Tax=Blattabacterium cuenoti TaxID=1653831 RepID=UPI00163C38B1|nr:hypothetical protein [Blattabacterium cuenoti]